MKKAMTIEAIKKDRGVRPELKDHQKLIEIEMIEERGGMKKGDKKHVGLSLAETLVKAKRAKYTTK